MKKGEEKKTDVGVKIFGFELTVGVHIPATTSRPIWNNVLRKTWARDLTAAVAFCIGENLKPV